MLIGQLLYTRVMDSTLVSTTWHTAATEMVHALASFLEAPCPDPPPNSIDGEIPRHPRSLPL